MPITQKLSEVVNDIEYTLRNRFGGAVYWIKAEIADVKKYNDKRWCFLKFTEKEGSMVTTEIKGVFWSNTYYNIENFEKATGQVFATGLEITCLVKVRFHKRYGLNLEVLEIDFAYAVGKLELERKQTIERLLKENILTLDGITGQFSSLNSRLALPIVVQRIALITAPASDGQRDFQNVVRNNKYGFAFSVTEYLTQIQGDTASALITSKLKEIGLEKEKFDIVVIARGGGSDTDFKAFNTFELVQAIASLPIPVLTGIGHDRNTSIADLAARQLRTPTEAATYIIDHNMNFDREIDDLKARLFRAADNCLTQAKRNLENYGRSLQNLSPATLLKKGFAIVTIDGKIITDPGQVLPNAAMETLLKGEVIHSTVTKKTTNDNQYDV